ncbi:hypothetical protein D3C85_1536570 [compost metagenome]
MSSVVAARFGSAIVSFSWCQRLNTSGLSSFSGKLVGSITMRRTTRRSGSLQAHQMSPAAARVVVWFPPLSWSIRMMSP